MMKRNKIMSLQRVRGLLAFALLCAVYAPLFSTSYRSCPACVHAISVVNKGKADHAISVASKGNAAAPHATAHAHRAVKPIPALHRHHHALHREDVERMRRKAQTNYYFDVQDDLDVQKRRGHAHGGGEGDGISAAYTAGHALEMEHEHDRDSTHVGGVGVDAYARRAQEEHELHLHATYGSSGSTATATGSGESEETLSLSENSEQEGCAGFGGCQSGRGVCSNSVCFCRTPYTGKKCEREVDVEPRISYTLVLGILLVSLFLGFAVGLFVNGCVASLRKGGKFKPYKQKRELWQLKQ